MNVVVNRYKSYMAMIKNSPGTKMFRSLWVEESGEKRDVFRDGELSCAAFVSSVLTLHNLIDDVHATVARTVEELEKFGWRRADNPKPGVVVVWKPRMDDDGERHAHIGFLVNAKEAVSTSAKERCVVRHPLDKLDGPREVEALYWYPALDE